MAQPGGMAAMSQLPGNMTKEDAQSVFQEYQRMKSQGVSQSDPQFIKVYNMLRSIHAHNQAQQQRAQYAQQLQNQQAASMQQNGHANGSSTGQGSPAQGQQGRLTMNEEQRALLRQQMAAFRHLSKDAPVPPEVQRAVFPSLTQLSSPTPMQTLDAADQVADAGASTSTATAPTYAEPPRRGYETYASPFDSLQKTIGYLDHSSRRNRPVIPSIMSAGIDVDRAREERENIIYNRLMQRKAELEALPATYASWDTTRYDEPTPDGQRKLKALIEYKSICLLHKQRALRQQVAREIVQANTLAMTANRAQYRRHKKQTLRDARITERLEKQQRDAREIKEKNKHNNQLRELVDHKAAVERAAYEQRQRVQRLGKLMLSTHQNIEKEEQKRIERTAKQRLQALKANDEETYLKLLGQAKDSRISHLLKQTDGFLNELAASVKDQQRANLRRHGMHVPEEEEEEELEDDEDGGKKIDYYEVAHRIKEEVVAQSTNLVGGTLKEYQIKGLQWMLSLYNNNLNGILADEMGLGKTIQTISLITYLIEKKRQPGPYLVIVPLSTLSNWNNEFEKWAPSVRRIVYKGPPNSRKQAQSQIRAQNFQVLLTTYEFIIKDRPVLSRVKWLHMIVDEGHRMKNAQSKLSSTITQYYSTRYRLILTGTPLQNNLPELWALLNFVLPTIFKSVKSFDEWFNTPFANTGSQDQMSLTEEEQILVIRRLHKVLRPFLLRRLKKDVEKDLPDKQERVVKCRLSALQAKLYNQLLHNNRLEVSDGKGGKIGLRGLSNMLMQMRKLCNHPFVFEEVEDQINPAKSTNDLLWRTAGKFELLDRILPKFRATGHRVLMFFQMTQIMNIMEDFMRLRGYQYLRLDGATKAEERTDLLKEFNAPGSPYFCFLLSTRAGGLGLNLQTADTVIIYDSDWNPHQDLQAQDRAHRIGQRNEVRILRLITTNSVEEKILERAQFKLDMDGKVIQAGKFDNKSTNDERDAMLRVMLETAEAAEDMESEEMNDDDLNNIMIRSEGELEIFQQMDRDRLATDKYGPGKKLPRLFSEAELPDIYLQEDVPQEANPAEDLLYGRGTRVRSTVKYDDGLTEEQWLDAVDNDDDTIEDAIARKQAKKARRDQIKGKRSGVDSPVAEEPSEDDSPAPKKRGRKPVKRKADEMSVDSEPIAAPKPAPKKRGRQNKVVETLTPEERAALTETLDNTYEAVMDFKAPDGRDYIDVFVDPVPRELYPDYYLLIKQAICMNDIGEKINNKKYQSCDEFARDMRLMFDNARLYNEDTSPVYADAQILDTKWLELLNENAELNRSRLGKAMFTGPAALAPGAGDAGSGFGDGSAAPSGTGTPIPGGIQLKMSTHEMNGLNG